MPEGQADRFGFGGKNLDFMTALRSLNINRIGLDYQDNFC